KATSNICSNQGLCALMATIYLALLGKQGIREVAEQNLAKAEYAKKQIEALDGYHLPFSPPTFNEFVVEGPEPAETLLKRLADQNILGGIALGKAWSDMDNRFLVCVTEQNSREEIDRLVQALSGGGQ
ncbi:MAG TPA: glycine dehydrogenase, partial [Desulfuromonadales bacterium]|nr:glycine dehydrogenase [Desulfuromonadales bacterium]